MLPLSRYAGDVGDEGASAPSAESEESAAREATEDIVEDIAAMSLDTKVTEEAPDVQPEKYALDHLKSITLCGSAA